MVVISSRTVSENQGQGDWSYSGILSVISFHISFIHFFKGWNKKSFRKFERTHVPLQELGGWARFIHKKEINLGINLVQGELQGFLENFIRVTS